MSAFDGTVSCLAECREIAREVISETRRTEGFEGSTSGLWALGHCHIDTAW
jgi:hypothetical protein